MWRFFENSPEVLTPGHYFFVPDNTPCLETPHWFGSQDWQIGDDQIGEFDPIVKMGNDKSLGWEWADGEAPDIGLPVIQIGDDGDFTSSLTFDPNISQDLRQGIDNRCFAPGPRCFTSNLLSFAIDDCALLLVLAGCVRALEGGNRVVLSSFLLTWLGNDATVTYDDGNADNPPTVVIQTKRNNLVILAGSHTWEIIGKQLISGFTGPTDYGTFSTLKLWFDAATYVFNFLNTVNVDYSLPTYLVGHSMGGATACVMWQRLHQAQVNRILRVVTFGCPKPGDTRLAEDMKLFMIGTHVWNTGDIVPAVPPDNSLQAALQLAFPFLPNAWFTQWVPHHRYLFMRPGAVWEKGPWESATFDQYVNFLITQLFGGAIGVPSQHHIDAYVSAINLHCPVPEPPFDSGCYALLLLPAEFGNGGVLLGGAGEVLTPSGTTLVLNGAGFLEPERVAGGIVLDGNGEVSVSSTPAGLVLDGNGEVSVRLVPAGLVLDGKGEESVSSTPAGLVLDGSGFVQPTRTPGGIVLDGSGVLTIPPGSSCASAALLTLGSPFSGSTSTSSPRWFYFPIVSGTEYHVEFTVPPNISVNAPVYHGPSCASLTFLGEISSVMLCIPFSATSNEFMYVSVSADLTGPHAYTLLADTGPC